MVLFVLLLFLGLASSEGQSLQSAICDDPTKFPCLSGHCIDKLTWCDTYTNCNDGSDEKYCAKGSQDPNHCSRDTFFFLCLDGSCIPAIGRCDDSYDCPDNSDEKNCTIDSYIDNKVVPEFQGISEHLEADRFQNRLVRLHRYVAESDNYEDLPYKNYNYQRNLARNWLKSQQKEDYGWGFYTARAVVAMHLSKEEFPLKEGKEIFSKNEENKEDMLMDKQLDIELSIALSRIETSTMKLSELALYINALLAACKNPRNFYGYDLVYILRERADSIYRQRKFLSPLVHLTLCLNNATSYEDIHSLHDILRGRTTAHKVDIISLSILATSCIIKLPQFSDTQHRRNMVEMLLNKIKISGLPGNIYELSLVMQALNEAKVDPYEWDRDEAIEFILNTQDKNGSFGDILATYYAIPILSGRSLLSLSENCGHDFSNGKTPLAILKNARRAKISVDYSLLFGNPVDMTQKIELQVAEGTDFLDIMRLAEEENPNFRFRLDETKVPFIFSIGGIPNDAERGLYWTLHTQNVRNKSDYIPYSKNIKDIVPRDKEELRFWLKQMS